MDKKKIIKQMIMSLEEKGINRQEIKAYLSETDNGPACAEQEVKQELKPTFELAVKKASFKPEVTYEIVYTDDTISRDYIAGKEIKGVIFYFFFTFFISAKYSPKRLSKSKSKEYCEAIKVKGRHCTEGHSFHWKCGTIHDNLKLINAVMEHLGCEQIDDRIIWAENVHHRRRAHPLWGETTKLVYDTYFYMCFPISGELSAGIGHIENFGYGCDSAFVRPVIWF